MYKQGFVVVVVVVVVNKLLYIYEYALQEREKKATSISFIKQNQEENWCMESNLPENWMPQ